MHPGDDDPPATVAAALALARRLGVDRLDAQGLLQHHLGRPRSWLIAHADAALPCDVAAALRRDLQRRADDMPLAYLTGWREFHGLRLQVGPQVLDPRPDTETLVDWALELLQGDLGRLPQPEVVDLGTGSGAIALAVKQRCPRARVLATDASAAALALARANAQRLGLALEFAAGDWWQAADRQRWQLALSNPPYIAGGDPHLAALRHEPMLALVPPGGDALAALRHLIAEAPPHLDTGGWLLLEHGHDQGRAVAGLLQARGFVAVQARRDLAGHTRCTGGRWPG